MEVVQEQYKVTKIGRIPKDWEVLKLGDIFTFKNGLNKGKEFFGYGIPIVNYMDVYRNEGIYLKDLKGLVHLTTDEINRFNVKKGDVFFTRTSETKEEIGYATVLLEDIKDGVFSGFVLRARTESTKLNLLFRKYCFSSSIARSQIYATSSISTRALTNGGSLSLVRIPLPPLPEQQKIAEILATVDEQISTTQAIIDKSKELKKGLMQKLFSEGIGHTEFKDTKIGRIPKDWEIVRAEDLCLKVTDGTHDSPKKKESGYNLVTSKNLKNGKLDFNTCYKISEADYIDVNKRSYVEQFDVLFGMIGTIGNPVIVEQNEIDFAVKNVGIFKTNGDENLGLWLCQYFNTEKITNYIIRQKNSSTQSFVALGLLRSFPIANPPLEERDKIVEILSGADAKIEKEEQEKAQLEQLKKGLMQQLLTGQKRVKV